MTARDQYVDESMKARERDARAEFTELSEPPILICGLLKYTLTQHSYNLVLQYGGISVTISGPGTGVQFAPETRLAHEVWF